MVLIRYKKSYADDIFEKYNFMTEIPENRCLKILCKCRFVAKIRDVTNTHECYILTNHIRSHIRASGHKLTLMTSV